MIFGVAELRIEDGERRQVRDLSVRIGVVLEWRFLSGKRGREQMGRWKKKKL